MTHLSAMRPARIAAWGRAWEREGRGAGRPAPLRTGGRHARTRSRATPAEDSRWRSAWGAGCPRLGAARCIGERREVDGERAGRRAARRRPAACAPLSPARASGRTGGGAGGGAPRSSSTERREAVAAATTVGSRERRRGRGNLRRATVRAPGRNLYGSTVSEVPEGVASPSSTRRRDHWSVPADAFEKRRRGVAPHRVADLAGDEAAVLQSSNRASARPPPPPPPSSPQAAAAVGVLRRVQSLKRGDERRVQPAAVAVLLAAAADDGVPRAVDGEDAAARRAAQLARHVEVGELEDAPLLVQLRQQHAPRRAPALLREVGHRQEAAAAELGDELGRQVLRPAELRRQLVQHLDRHFEFICGLDARQRRRLPRTSSSNRRRFLPSRGVNTCPLAMRRLRLRLVVRLQQRLFG